MIALVGAEWPRASRRLARWQRELARGLRLSGCSGEETRQTCTPLLVDPCTGDVGEVCLRLSKDELRCQGRRLPDGRCELYRFARLPLSPRAAPTVAP